MPHNAQVPHQGVMVVCKVGVGSVLKDFVSQSSVFTLVVDGGLGFLISLIWLLRGSKNAVQSMRAVARYFPEHVEQHRIGNSVVFTFRQYQKYDCSVRSYDADKS
jgi:hypothetical protein